MNNYPIAFQDVSFQYSYENILKSVSFSLNPGEITGLLGPNGAGKSTLMKIAIGLLTPQEGQVTQFGQNIETLTQEGRSLFGFDSIENTIPENYLVNDILNFVKSTYHNWDQNFADRLVRELDLFPPALVGSLSTGMKRKLGIICAIAHRPKLLVIDESLSGLDVQSRLQVIDLLGELASEGTTILYATHIVSDIERLSDNIMILNHGKILLSEATESITEKYILIDANSIKKPNGKLLNTYQEKDLIFLEKKNLEQWSQNNDQQYLHPTLENLYMHMVHGAI